MIDDWLKYAAVIVCIAGVEYQRTGVYRTGNRLDHVRFNAAATVGRRIVLYGAAVVETKYSVDLQIIGIAIADSYGVGSETEIRVIGEHVQIYFADRVVDATVTYLICINISCAGLECVCRNYACVGNCRRNTHCRPCKRFNVK